jgi:hypothetical protein
MNARVTSGLRFSASMIDSSSFCSQEPTEDALEPLNSALSGSLGSSSNQQNMNRWPIPKDGVRGSEVEPKIL